MTISHPGKVGRLSLDIKDFRDPFHAPVADRFGDWGIGAVSKHPDRGVHGGFGGLGDQRGFAKTREIVDWENAVSRAI